MVSKDERYVLCYAWHKAHRIFLNRALCVRCLHSDLEIHNIEPKTSIQRRGILFLKEGHPRRSPQALPILEGNQWSRPVRKRTLVR